MTLSQIQNDNGNIKEDVNYNNNNVKNFMR